MNVITSDRFKRLIYPAAFFAFIVMIIYQADTANYNFAFKMVGKIPYGDKICHMILYGFMAFLLDYSLKGKRWFKLSAGGLIVFTFAFLEELSQAYFPSRSCDIDDIIADIIGITLFIVLPPLFKRSKA